MKQIDDVLSLIVKKKLLVLMPHADDETVMVGGLMRRLVKMGWLVKVVCVTNGVMGRIHVHGKGRSVVQIRREELGLAMDELGVSDYGMWRFSDGRLREEEGWKVKVEGLIEKFGPGLVISYGPSGVSGHPDHLALGKFVFEYLNGKNVELWWPGFEGYVKDYLESKKLKTFDRLVEPEIELLLSADEIVSKKNALEAHQSQKLDGPLSWLENQPCEYYAPARFNKEYNFDYVEFDLGD